MKALKYFYMMQFTNYFYLEKKKKTYSSNNLVKLSTQFRTMEKSEHVTEFLVAVQLYTQATQVTNLQRQKGLVEKSNLTVVLN